MDLTTKEAIEFEIGGGAKPSNVDPVRTLRAAAAYFAAVRAAVEELDFACVLEGTGIVENCWLASTILQTEMPPDDLTDVIAEVSREISLGGRVSPPIREARDAILLLPEYPVRTRFRGQAYDVKTFAVPAESEALVYRELGDLRCTLLRVGGKSPMARFELEGIGTKFTLRCTQDMATRIAEHLYQEIMVRAEYEITHAGKISNGEILEFQAIPDHDPMTTLQAWFGNQTEPV